MSNIEHGLVFWASLLWKIPLVVGIPLLIAAAVAKQYIARRKFYRRGPTGLETFKTYSSVLSIEAYEGLIGFLATAAIVLGAISVLHFGYGLLTARHALAH